MPALSPLAKRVIPLLDLTNVDDDCTAAVARALCEKALASPAAPAAVCLRPAFVGMAKALLAGSGIRLATVINFPDAVVTPEQAGRMCDQSLLSEATRKAVAEGADEIDLVFAWRAFLDGDRDGPRQAVEAVRAACGSAVLKVILESGAYPDTASLRAACDLVIDAGADFLKTSTTRLAPAATPEAVAVLCEASRAVGKLVGVKVSGGVRTPEQAQHYLDIIADHMGLNWIETDHVRIGASKLLDALLGVPVPETVGY